MKLREINTEGIIVAVVYGLLMVGIVLLLFFADLTGTTECIPDFLGGLVC